MQTDAELLSQFRDFMARKGQGPATFVPLQNHPQHRGVIDANYVRPGAVEFPKVLYHVSGVTKIVASAEEEEALLAKEGAAWSETPAARPTNWRDKLGEVYTRNGFRVFNHHLAFLRSNNVDVETLKDAATFLDQLDTAQQEAFFREAEEQAETIPAAKEAPKNKAAKEPPKK